MSRVDRRPLCDVFGWTVRDPLPAVPIPLQGEDGEVRVNLGDVFRRTYRRGRYPRLTDYGQPPPPPAFPPADAEWVLAAARAAAAR